MSNTDITVRRIRNHYNLDDSSFLSAYKGLLFNPNTLSKEQKFYLLKTAIRFLNSDDLVIENLGYSIVLRYSNAFKDYKPLYDVALAKGYIPISKFVEDKYLSEDVFGHSFSYLYLSAYQENFKVPGKNGDTYRTRGQMVLNHFAKQDDHIAVVAPTSYGKSEMIITKVRDNPGKKICVLVPSKALLAQTKTNLIADSSIRENFGKIIVHPDMFKDDGSAFVAVLTQERLLRLLQKNKDLSFDLVLIDEAHNLLEDTERAHLLAQVLLILQKRNAQCQVNFFTPFLVDVGSLRIRNYKVELVGKPIKENIKVERFYACDFTGDPRVAFLYDQYLDRTFPSQAPTEQDEISFITANRSQKNIVYLNRPRDAEEVALRISAPEREITLGAELQKALASITDLIHPDYNLVKCLKKGILYHHGVIPEVVRLYIEDIYSKHSEFKVIVTTSTLLEGVNIPAQKIFLLTPVKGKRGYLTSSQFKNLIGRVSRFREIFNPQTGDLGMLEPQVYVIKGKYAPDRFDLEKFYADRADLNNKLKDKVENPLLQGAGKDEDAQKILEYLENMETGSSGLSDVRRPTTSVGKLCFENNVYDFDVLANEEIIQKNLDDFLQKGQLIDSPTSLMEAIYEVFFKDVKMKDEEESVARLQRDVKARNFYAMFLKWRADGAPYPLMIGSFMGYWESREKNGDKIIFVGRRWGEVAARGSHNLLYVDISKKTRAERINLAISKIKEEQEFVDYYLLKYIEILNDFKLIEHEFYDRVKYGTSNRHIICILKNGFSLELASLLTKEPYFARVRFDLDNDTFSYEKDLIELMIENQENDVLIFEARNNAK